MALLATHSRFDCIVIEKATHEFNSYCLSYLSHLEYMSHRQQQHLIEGFREDDDGTRRSPLNKKILDIFLPGSCRSSWSSSASAIMSGKYGTPRYLHHTLVSVLFSSLESQTWSSPTTSCWRQLECAYQRSPQTFRFRFVEVALKSSG